MADATTTTTQTETAPNLRDSVLQAFAESEKAAGAAPVEGEETVETDKSVVAKEDNKEEVEETVEIDASPEEIRAALSLMRAIGDPKRAAQTIKELAEVGGYDLTKKAEVKQLERDAKAILREKLGDSYEILGGDRLAEAFDAILSSEVEKRTKPAMDRITQAEVEANTQKANTAMDAMWARHNITDAKVREGLAGKMLEKMQAMPAGPRTEINSYLDDMFALANRENEKARTVKTTVRKIQQNATEAREASGEGSGVDESRVRTGSKLPSVKEAVAAAFRGEKLS